jgi:hypothetical protein
MNKELNKLGKKVVALHECSKRGMKKKGYAMFKEAMQAVMMLEANGCKSEVIEKAKAILAEYYNEYKSQIKKDTTRVIVEAKNSAEAIAKKAAKEQKKQLKGWLKEVVNNVQHMREAIGEGSDARIGFHANQIKLAVEEIISAVGTEPTM